MIIKSATHAIIRAARSERIFENVWAGGPVAYLDSVLDAPADYKHPDYL
jgi:hypothetical protein